MRYRVRALVMFAAGAVLAGCATVEIRDARVVRGRIVDETGQPVVNTPVTDERPWFVGGDRKPVFSAGTGFRFNLFGFAIAEVNLVHPFDRPDKNWVWELNLQPGF